MLIIIATTRHGCAKQFKWSRDKIATVPLTPYLIIGEITNSPKPHDRYATWKTICTDDNLNAHIIGDIY